MARITPPDGAAWTLDAVPIEHGVGLVLGFDLAGQWHAVQLDMDRPESRKIAAAILRAGGDATERTFPKPQTRPNPGGAPVARDDTPILTRVFVTVDPLATGRIEEVDARIQGDVIAFRFDGAAGRWLVCGEGRGWHRTRSAARNYACQLRDARLAEVRAEVERLERMDFGRRR